MSTRSKSRIAVGVSVGVHLLVAGLFVVAWMLEPAAFHRCTDSVPIALTSEDEVPVAFSLSFDRPLRQAPTVETAEPAKSTLQAQQREVEKPAVPPQATVAQAAPANPHTVGSNNDQPANPGANSTNQRLHGPMRRGSIVYVLDTSGSMGIGTGSKLSQAVGLLKASLRQLGPEVRFQIVTYQREAHVFHLPGRGESWLNPSVEILHSADSELDELIGEGVSNHSGGLLLALGMQPDLLIWITDAPELTMDSIRVISGRNRKPSVVHAFGLGDKAEGNPETRLWLGNTGGAVHVIQAVR